VKAEKPKADEHFALSALDFDLDLSAFTFAAFASGNERTACFMTRDRPGPQQGDQTGAFATYFPR
jgi:hypothetical protein